jgi:hypothetical protein
MNDTELDEIAAAVVRKLLAGDRTVVQTAKLRVGPGRQQVERAVSIATPAATLPTATLSSRSLEDISWRGPRMLAAWTPAAGTRRVADFVDHTLLKPEATRKDIVKLCAEAREHRFAAVCVNPCWVELCAGELAGTEVAVASVCGFPLGATTSRAKASEAGEVVSRGATEVDMVAALGQIKGGEWKYVEDDIRAVVEASRGALVKVIIESAILSPEDIVKASAVAKLAGDRKSVV